MAYPAGIYNPRTKANKSGVVYDVNKPTVGYAEDVTKLDDEVVAVETELGTDASGAYATVKAWLTALTSAAVNYFTDLADTPADYTGQASKVVSVNVGETGLEFTTPAGGGPTIYEATVGATGADYTTLKGAIDAGKTRILVIDNTTEVADITMPSNLVVHGIGREAVNVDMATFKFLDNAGANSGFDFARLKITFAYSVAGNLFGTFKKLVLENLYIDNNSVVNSCKIVSVTNNYGTTHVQISNCMFDLPSYQYCGIDFDGGGCTMDSCHFVGGGSNCQYALEVQKSASVSNVLFTGSFAQSTTSAIKAIVYVLAGGLVSNIIVDSIKFGVYVSTGGMVSGVNKMQQGVNTWVYIYVAGFLANAYLDEGVLEIGTAGAVVNCTVWNGGKLKMVGSNSMISNISAQHVLLELTGSDNLVSNCILKNTTVSGDRNSMTGSRVGDAAGETITIDASADKTQITGCRTNDAIVNNGTNTTLTGNVT